MSGSRHVITSAKLIAVCTLVSRVTGMLRDMLLLHLFGLTWVADAFNYGFQFPNLFRRLFGEGALAAVFVPRFTNTLESEGKESAWRLLARTRALLVTVLIGLVVALELVLLCVWLATPRDDAARAQDTFLLLALTAVMLPFVLSVCVTALLGSILNCLGSFVPAALAPIVLNVGMIAAIWAAPASASREQAALIVALSVPLAGLFQLGLLAPALRAHGVRLGWELNTRDEHVRRMIALMGPVAIGQGALLLSTFLDVQVCALLTQVSPDAPRGSFLGLTFDYPLKAGALSAVSVAQRLYQFPLGVLVISLATAALPAFSRLAVRAEWPAWAEEVRRTFRVATLEGVLAGAMMLVLAEPIVRLLFEYGNFMPADTSRAAYVLQWYGAGMWAFCVQHIVQRGFYSVGDVRTPVYISCTLLPINFFLSLFLLWIDGIREAAFAISSSLTSALSVVIGLACLRRHARAPLLDAATIRTLVRIVFAAIVAAAAVHALRAGCRFLPPELTTSLAGRAIETLGGLAVGTATYAGAAWLFGVREVDLLLRTGRGRRDPAGPADNPAP
ncbi:MAG: murein biosynthesis integral membrane protein MurJ [Phycisphaerae bacterium]|jgi:putative peptidoglycan lipid II flippase